jgi:hypothetical protein
MDQIEAASVSTRKELAEYRKARQKAAYQRRKALKLKQKELTQCDTSKQA